MKIRLRSQKPTPAPAPFREYNAYMFFSFLMQLCFFLMCSPRRKKNENRAGTSGWYAFFCCCFGSRGGLAGPQRPLSGSSILVAPRWFTIFEVRGLIRMQSTTRVSGLHSPLWPPVCPPAVQQLQCLALTWLNLGAPGDSEPRGAGTTHLCFDCIFLLLYLYLLLSVA